MPDLLKLEDFTELKAGELKADVEGRWIPLDLVEHQRLPPVPTRDAPFEIVLQGPAQPAMGQATYTFDHPRLGKVAIFVVPISKTPEHVLYEAIFN